MNTRPDDFAAVHRQLARWARPARATRQRIWSVDGIGRMNDGCACLGCCDDDMLAQLQASGYDQGMSGVSSSMIDAVVSTLKLIPGASSAIANGENIAQIYNVITNQAANQLNAELEEYTKKVATMNASLPKIYTTSDPTQRAELLARYQKTAASLTAYGSALIDKMNSYNNLAQKIASLSYENVNPPTVTSSGMPALSVPGMSGLGFVQVAVIAVGATVAIACIAAVLYHYADVVQTYMQYDLKVRGIEGELNTDYQGLTGAIQKFIDKTGGSLLSTALLIGAGVVAFFFIKNYMAKKGVISSAPAKAEVKAAVKELEVAATVAPSATAPAGPEPTAKDAVKELSSIAQGA